MASKVNTKFVVGLSVGLLIVCAGVAGTAFYLLNNTAADNIRAGDKAAAAGDYNDAAGQYGKAVNKEKTNTAYLAKWVDALSKSTADTQTQYGQRYNEWRAAKRQQAVVDTGNTAVQMEFLGLQAKIVRGAPYSQDAYQNLAGEADTMVRLHEASGPGDWEVLRRYRALANLPLYFNSPTPREEVLTQAVADLKAALRVNPADSEAAIALADIAIRKAAKARDELNTEEAAALEKESDDTLSAFLAANPDHADVLLSVIQRDVIRTQRALTESGASMADTDKASKEFTERAIPLLDRAFANAKTMPRPLPEELLAKFRTVEALAVGSAVTRTEELARDSVKAQPNSPVHLAFLADLLTLRGDVAGAIDQYAAIAKLPIPPISFEGWMLHDMKTGALAQQAYLTAKGAFTKTLAEERAESIARAKSLREELVKLEASDSVRLLLVDATLAILDGSNESTVRAGQLLDQYNRKTDRTNPEALYLAAHVALQQRQLGAARDLLEGVLRVQPTNITAMVMLAEIHSQLQDFSASLNYYRAAVRLDPTHEAARRGESIMSALVGESRSDDPVVNDIVEGERIRLGSAQSAERDKAVLEHFEKAYARNKDPRIIAAYAGALMTSQQRDRALAVLDQGLLEHPGHEMLVGTKARIEAGNSEQFALGEIDRANLPPVDRHLQRFTVFANLGKDEQAQAELDEAIKISPNDTRVVELRFLRALDAKKFDEARALSEQAVRANADNQGGDTYRARLLSEQGDHKQAITLLKSAVDRGGAQPEVHRLLGRVLVRDNRHADAAESFRASLRMRPNDVPTVVDLLNCLTQMGSMTEALSVARDFQKLGEGDSRFLPVWLNIEAAVGDRALALSRREELHRQRPADRQNTLALAELHLQANKPASAQPLIDKVRAEADDLDAVSLDALSKWKQGKQTEAKKLFMDFVEKQDKERVPPAAGAFAGFLAQRGDSAGAVAVLEAVRDQQSAELMEVDRALSDFHTSLGNREKALEHSRRIVAGKADTAEHIHAKRVVELLTMSGKFDEAQQALSALPNAASPDAMTLLLTAQLRSAQKDERGQTEALNQAVAKFPGDPAVFFRRGEFFMRKEQTHRDADADLSRAIELSPQTSVFFQRRAQLRMQMMRDDDAVLDMKEAIRLAPGDNNLLFGTLTQLFQIGRDSDVIDLANDAATQRARDAGLQLAMGQFFQRLPVPQGNTAILNRNIGLCRQYFRAAYTLDNSEYNALVYMGALLAYPDPDYATAEKVISDAGEAAKKSPGYQMTLARIRMMQNKKAEALRIAQDALRLADPNNKSHMNAWMSDLARMMPDIKDRIAFLDSTGRAGIAPEWMLYYKSADQINLPETAREGLAGMKQVAASSKNPLLQESAAFDLGRAYLVLKQHPEAVAAWKDGLAKFPDHPEMLNNTAYVLAEELNRAEEAVPLAKRAVELSGTNPDMLDTYGRCLFLAGRAKESIAPLEQAVGRSPDARSGVIVAIHLIEAYLADGNKEGAKTTLRTVENIEKMQPQALTAEQRTQVQELRGKAEAP